MTNSRLDVASGDDQRQVDIEINPPRQQTAPDDSAETPFPVLLGQALREAREGRQWSLEHCGHELKLPVRVLRKLEAGDYAGIDSVVYLRNYLSSYARCLGFPAEAIVTATKRLAPITRKPDLVATGGISHSRYLFDRYTSAITYAVLTAVIVVPLVWLGFQGGLNRDLAQVTSLDPLPQNQASGQALQADESTPSRHRPDAKAGKPTAEKPLMASMAPFAALDRVDKLMAPVSPKPPKPVTPVASTPEYTLRLRLTQPSWVAITNTAGERLEYQLLPAGTDKSFQTSKPLAVSLGDVTGARVTVAGKSVDLSRFERANVAHFRVVLADGQTLVKPARQALE